MRSPSPIFFPQTYLELLLMIVFDFKMNSDPQCNSGTGEDTGLCECNCRCQNHQHAFAAKKADIMADFVSDCSFLLEKGDVRMLLPGG